MLNIHDLRTYVDMDVGCDVYNEGSICYREMTETDSNLQKFGVGNIGLSIRAFKTQSTKKVTTGLITKKTQSVYIHSS